MVNKGKENKIGFNTLSIHHGKNFSDETGCIMPPIFSTSTFKNGNEGKFDYTRSGNPNFQILERVLRSIEESEYCTVFGSGISAVTAIVSSLKSGDKILCEENLYGCTIRMFEKIFYKFGIQTFYCDFTSNKYLSIIAKVNPDLIWLESPTNPLLKILNLKEICKEAQKRGIPTVVDNTFCTAILQKPLKLGATISLISTTKFINGHSDALGGAVLTNDQNWNKKMIFAQKSLGLNPSPFDCWLITRGIKTLPLRINQQTKTASLIANVLKNNKFVDKLIYPFDKDHLQYETAKSQMKNGGSLITIKLNFNKKETFDFCNRLRFFSLAESLGGVESLICHPATMTHASVDIETKKRIGIDDSLVRLSIGCEDFDDLISDIINALKKG